MKACACKTGTAPITCCEKKKQKKGKKGKKKEKKRKKKGKKKLKRQDDMDDGCIFMGVYLPIIHHAIMIHQSSFFTLYPVGDNR